MDAALIGYPLADAWRRRFEAQCGGAPRYLSLPELRRKPWRALLQELRSLSVDTLYILLESPGLQALVPAFLCLSALVRCRRIVIVNHDFSQTATSRGRAASACASVIAASWSGRGSLRRARRRAGQLLQSPRLEVSLGPADRVLYLKTNLWLGVAAGGSVGHVAGVVNSLLGQRLHVDFAAVEPPLMTSPAVNFVPAPPPRSYGLPLEINLYRFQEQFTRAVQAWHRQQGEPRFQFVYQRLSLCSLTGVEMSRQLGVPLVLEYNGSEVWCSKNWGRDLRYARDASAMEDACLRHAHLVVTVSDVLRDELIDRGVDRERIVSHPNGIDPAVFNPAKFSRSDAGELKTQWNIPREATLVGFVGTFGPWHGVEKLAVAIRRLATEHADWLARRPVHFLIVGDGLGMPAVKETLSDPRCRGLFTLTGLVPQNEAPRYIAACDLMVSPHVGNSDGSRFFGSPTKLFEYMAMGKAIIASDLEQIGEILARSLRAGDLPREHPTSDEQRLALLTQPGDVAGLLEGIRFLTEFPQWRTALGENARREALAKYTWDRHVEALLDRLRRVCAVDRPRDRRRAA
jgi:glycosyltransferase involved in cell wall biosynthesis